MTDQISSASPQSQYMELAADIVSAFVSNNSVPAAELPALIGSVHAALQNVSNPVREEQPKYEPAVSVKKSVTPEFLISLVDGKKYKSLRRHLRGHGLSPEQYRQRYGLPAEYPMVASAYAARRSELAKAAGLGQQRRKGAAKTADTSETVADKAPKKRGRKKAA